MVNKSTFGQFLRQKRNEKGMTQKELAEKLFLSESAISKWEKGKSYPDITMIPDICSVLDISEHELISGANYAVNFADWAHFANGNVYLLILTATLIISISLLAAGIAKLRRTR